MAETAGKLVTVIGGSGFIGRHVVRALAKRGCRVRPAVRRPDLAGHLQPLGAVGQIMPVQANVRYPDSVAGRLSGRRRCHQPDRHSAQCRRADVRCHSRLRRGRLSAGGKRSRRRQTFVQMSAIGADASSASNYAKHQGRGRGPGAARNFPAPVIVRPSVVFGPEDDLFNRFAAMARISPALPLIGGGHTKFQPVFAGDVAEGIAARLPWAAKSFGGKTYEFGGPEVMSLKEIMEFTLETTGRRRLLAPVPFAIARLKGAVLGLLPKPLLTMDQVELLRSDNVVSEAAKEAGLTLDGLGITPEGVEAIVPGYLYRYRKAGQFTRANA